MAESLGSGSSIPSTSNEDGCLSLRGGEPEPSDYISLTRIRDPKLRSTVANAYRAWLARTEQLSLFESVSA
jgi:hypothetical protein